MDKIKSNARVYKSDIVSITVSNGEVIECCYDSERKILPKAKNFYDILEKTMRMLYVSSPRKFEKMYKSLYLSTREYKIAKRIYGPIIAPKKKK